MLVVAQAGHAEHDRMHLCLAALTPSRRKVWTTPAVACLHHNILYLFTSLFPLQEWKKVQMQHTGNAAPPAASEEVPQQAEQQRSSTAVPEPCALLSLLQLLPLPGRTDLVHINPGSTKCSL